MTAMRFLCRVPTAKVVRVGFEPTPPKRLRPERSALDHSATSPRCGQAGMRSAGAGCRLQTCRRGDPQRFNSAFPAINFGGLATWLQSTRSAGFEPARAEPTGFQVQPRDHLGTIASRGGCRTSGGALSSVEERPFRIREVEGSNPSVSTFSCHQQSYPSG